MATHPAGKSRYGKMSIELEEDAKAAEVCRTVRAMPEMIEDAPTVPVRQVKFRIVKHVPCDGRAGERAKVDPAGGHGTLGRKIGQLDAEGLKGETAASGGLAARTRDRRPGLLLFLPC